MVIVVEVQCFVFGSRDRLMESNTDCYRVLNWKPMGYHYAILSVIFDEYLVFNGLCGRYMLQMVRKLHFFLQASLPDLYAQRAQEVVKEEQESDVASPEIPLDSPCSSCPGQASSKDFSCDKCGSLVFLPVVLNCGHVVCAAPCRGEASDPCPCCQAPSVGDHTCVCSHLWNLLRKAFQSECEERAKELSCLGVDVERLMVSPRQVTPSSEAAEASPSGIQNNNDMIQGARDARSTNERAGLMGVPLSTNGILAWLQRSDYPHFGVGCDVCGQYPILGRRYRCRDCPENIGFDLCGPCYDRGVGSTLGRFNQRHGPEHTLELVSPTMTKLHILKAVHPELDFDRLLSLIEMAWQDDGDQPEDDQPGSSGVPAQSEEMLTAQDPADAVTTEEGSEDGLGEVSQQPMMRARGPRPTFDPHAEWPSPAAGNSNNCD